MYRQNIIISLSALIFLLSFVNINSQMDKDEVYKQVLKSYKGLKTIDCSFYSKNLDIKGTLRAKKGNKYILDIPNRRIVCDGATLWNYSPTDKKLVISEYEDDESSISLEKFFFSFLDDYTASRLFQENNSKGKKLYGLELIATDDNKRINGIEKVIIKFEKDNFKKLRYISVYDGTEKHEWLIDKISLNKKISDKAFNFSAPEGTDIIDIR